MEGFWGCCVFGVLLPIFQNINCTGELCHGGKLEDSLAAIKEFQSNHILMYQSLCNIITIAGFNVTGVMITKYASAAQRSTVDTCRTLVIWCVFLALGKEKFLIGELFGFFLLVLGTLVYNEIIEIPLAFMNRNTKSSLAKREEIEKAAIQAANSTSATTLGSGEEINESTRLMEKVKEV